VKSQKVFHYASFAAVDKIVEIKNLNAISQQILNRDRQTSQMMQKTRSDGRTPESKSEDVLAG